MSPTNNSAVNMSERHIELYEEFERVIVDPEHHFREMEEEQEEEKRLSYGTRQYTEPAIQAPRVPYVQRVLALMRKPHALWNRDDYIFAAQVVKSARFTAQHTEHKARQTEREETGTIKRKTVRDEFDRRLWGLPPRPNVSHDN